MNVTIQRYQLPLPGGRIILAERTSDGNVAFCLFDKSVSTKLSHIVSPIDFKRVPANKMPSVISKVSPRLVPLGDSYSLYLDFTLLGGMMPPPAAAGAGATASADVTEELGAITVPHLLRKRSDITNKDLGIVVKVNLEVATDCSIAVSVSSGKHKFPGESRERDSRFITVKPFGEFSAFLVQLKRALFGVTFTDKTPYNGSLIRDYVLGNPQTADEQRDAEAALQRAFKDKRGFTVIISQDGNWIDFEMEPDRACVIM